MTYCDSTTPYFKDYHYIINNLRCPVCEGQMIASSDAIFAINVKKDVCAYLQQGIPKEQILVRINEEYGHGLITLNSSDNSWIIPAGLLILLVCLILLLMKKVRIWQ